MFIIELVLNISKSNRGLADTSFSKQNYFKIVSVRGVNCRIGHNFRNLIGKCEMQYQFTAKCAKFKFNHSPMWLSQHSPARTFFMHKLFTSFKSHNNTNARAFANRYNENLMRIILEYPPCQH